MLPSVGISQVILNGQLLTNYLGGINTAGGKMKEIGTTHWETPNSGATNESGFTALPGGFRDWKGTFYYLGHSGLWWDSVDAYWEHDDFDYSYIDYWGRPSGTMVTLFAA